MTLRYERRVMSRRTRSHRICLAMAITARPAAAAGRAKEQPPLLLVRCDQNHDNSSMTLAERNHGIIFYARYISLDLLTYRKVEDT